MLKFAKALLVCLPFVSSLSAQQTTYAFAQAPVTLRELVDPVVDSNELREIRHEDKERAIWPVAQTAMAWDTPLVPAAAPPPPVTMNFASNTTDQVAPGDASGAVGKNHIISATNYWFTVHTRNGQTATSKFLFNFLEPVTPGTGNLDLDYYDPRVVYDSVADRWVALGMHDGREIILAVTQTGDPTGTWSRYKIRITNAFGEIDFTRLALTRDTVMIATHDDAGRTWVLSTSKTDLYARPVTLPMRTYSLDEWGAAPVTAEDSPVEYVVYNDGLDLIVTRLDQLNSFVTVKNNATWSRSFGFAPQLGTTNSLDLGWGWIETAVLRGNRMYSVQTVGLSNPTRTSVLWRAFHPQTGERLGGGMIDDATGGKWYAFPSLAVNRSGAMLIAFSTFSTSTYPSAGYAYVNAIGLATSVGTIKNGTAAYTGADRWGDYTTTVVDPQQDSAFWTLQLIAEPKAWRAWWARIPEPAPARNRSVRH